MKNEVLKYYSLFVTYSALGLRATELLNTNWGDLDLEKATIKVLRKGNKEQVLPLPSIAHFVLSLYAEVYHDKDNTPLWKNSRGNRLSYDSLRRKFHSIAKQIGLTGNTRACHAFRYLLISELALEHVPSELLQWLAGHESIKYLNPYIKTREVDVRKQVQNLKTFGVATDDN